MYCFTSLIPHPFTCSGIDHNCSLTSQTNAYQSRSLQSHSIQAWLDWSISTHYPSRAHMPVGMNPRSPSPSHDLHECVWRHVAEAFASSTITGIEGYGRGTWGVSRNFPVLDDVGGCLSLILTENHSVVTTVRQMRTCLMQVTPSNMILVLARRPLQGSHKWITW